MKLLTVFGASLSILLIACSPKATESTTTDAIKPVMPALVEEGKSIYEAKCQSCHGLKVIDNYSVERWAKVLPNMAEKAELSEAEKNTVNGYIQWELAN